MKLYGNTFIVGSKIAGNESVFIINLIEEYNDNKS